MVVLLFLVLNTNNGLRKSSLEGAEGSQMRAGNMRLKAEFGSFFVVHFKVYLRSNANALNFQHLCVGGATVKIDCVYLLQTFTSHVSPIYMLSFFFYVNCMRALHIRKKQSRWTKFLLEVTYVNGFR